MQLSPDRAQYLFARVERTGHAVQAFEVGRRERGAQTCIDRLTRFHHRGDECADDGLFALEDDGVDLAVAAPQRGRARRGAARPELAALIERIAREHGHPPALLSAMIEVESNFNVNAVSPKGALGLMQVMPATGKRFVAMSTPQHLLDPWVNLSAGARYLSELRTRFGDRLDLVLAAYNAGEGAVLKYGRQIPPYNETRAYVAKVLASYRERSSLPLPGARSR